MKKIIIVSTFSFTTLVLLVMVFALVGSGKRTIALAPSNAAYSLNATSTDSINLQPHEMAASKIKEVLLDELQTGPICLSDERFFFEYHSCSPKLLACLLMATKEHAAARKLLQGNGKLDLEQLQALRDHEATRDAMRELEVLEGQTMGNVTEKLIEIVKGLDVTPLNQHAYKRAGYATYYADKKEDFSLVKQDAWEVKQKNVLKILQDIKPQTVLDLGSNTGWFSRLAATYGARVIATDIDETCIEYQYQAAKDACLSVTPLLHAFEKLNDNKEVEQLQSDVVLCLALIHHLVFVSGLTISEILEKLSKVTKKVLVLEFIDLGDCALQKGLNNPLFFSTDDLYKKALHTLHNYAQENYHIDNLLKISKNFFKKIEVLESNPSSRRLIVLSK